MHMHMHIAQIIIIYNLYSIETELLEIVIMSNVTVKTCLSFFQSVLIIIYQALEERSRC